MSKEIDNRIVSVTFDNAQFEKEIRNTAHSLKEFETQLNDVGVQEISNGIESLTDKFTALKAVAILVLADLTSEAIKFGAEMGKNVLDKVSSLGLKRALNIEGANFMLKGMGLDVESAMDSASKAVQDTAFGLDAAASAAARFGASGVESGDNMTQALRGVAGVAAMTNTSYGEIADIFSEAAARGKITGDTLMRLNVRSLNAAAVLSKSMGISQEAVKKLASEGEISFNDFSRIMDETFGEHAKSANETYSGSLSNVNAALGRIGASFQVSRLGMLRDIFNATIPVLKGVHEGIKPLIDGFAMLNAATAALVKTSLADLIGADSEGKASLTFVNTLKEAFTNITQAIATVYTSVKKLVSAFAWNFSNVFKGDPASYLLKMSEAVRNLTNHLVVSDRVAEGFGKIFGGVLSVLRLAMNIIVGLVKVVGSLVTSLLSGTGGLAQFVGRLFEYVTFISWAVIESGMLSDVFGKIARVAGVLGSALSTVIGFLGNAVWWTFTTLLKAIFEIFKLLSVPIIAVANYLKDMFSGGSAAAEAAVGAFNRVKDALGGLFTSTGSASTALGLIQQKFRDFADWIVSVMPSEESFVKGFSAIGDFFVNLIEKIRKILPTIDEVKEAFSSVGGFLKLLFKPIEIIFAVLWGIVSGVVGMFGIAVDSMVSLTKPADEVKGTFEGLGGALGVIETVVSGIIFGIKKLGENLYNAVGFLGEQVTHLFSFVNDGGIQRAIDKNFGRVVIASIGILLFKLTGIFKSFGDAFAEGDLLGLKKFFDGLKDTMEGATEESWVDKIKGFARAILEVAIAVAILVGSVWVLSKIPLGSLAKGIGAITALLGLITGMFTLLSRFTAGGFKFAAIGGSILAISLGILVMAGGIYLLGRMEEDKLEQGMFALVAVLGMFTLMFSIMGGFGDMSNASKIGSGILKISAALLLITGAVYLLGRMDVETLKQGGIAAAAIMGVITIMVVVFGAMNKFLDGTDVSSIGSGILKMSAAMILIGIALRIIGGMNADDLSRSLWALLAIGAGLTAMVVVFAAVTKNVGEMTKIGVGLMAMSIGVLVIAASLRLLDGITGDSLFASVLAVVGIITVLSTAAMVLDKAEKGILGVLAMAASVYIIAEALNLLSTVDPKTLLIISLAIGLLVTIMTIAMVVGQGAGMGILALLGMAAAIWVFAEALKSLIDLDLDKLVKSLLALVAAVVIMTIIGLVLSALGPIAAVAAVGLMVFAVAAIAFAFAAQVTADAFVAIADAAERSGPALVTLLTELITFIPELGTALAKAFINMATEILEAVPALATAFGEAGVAIIGALRKIIPEVIYLIGDVIAAILTVMRDHKEEFGDTGWELILEFLSGLDRNMEAITALGISAFLKFLDGVTARAEDISGAVVTLIAEFIRHFGSEENVTKLVNAGSEALGNIIDGLIVLSDLYIQKIKELIVSILRSMATAMVEATDEILGVAIAFFDGMTKVLNERGPELRSSIKEFISACLKFIGVNISKDDSGAFLDIAKAIIRGVTNAIPIVGPALGIVGQWMADRVLGGFEEEAEIKSPSRAFYRSALNIPKGVVAALKDDTTTGVAARDLANRTIDAFTNSIMNINSIVETMDEFEPTISPVLDLEGVRQEAKSLSGILDGGTLDANLSSLDAKALSVMARGMAVVQDSEPTSIVNNLTFEQVNNSPEPLSTKDIYNATRSQIQMAKQELELV